MGTITCENMGTTVGDTDKGGGAGVCLGGGGYVPGDGNNAHDLFLAGKKTFD